MSKQRAHISCKDFFVVYVLSAWCKVFLKKLLVVHLDKMFPSLYRIRRFVVYSQEPTTGFYPESTKSSLHPHTYVKSILILSYSYINGIVGNLILAGTFLES
jgi:hypothetical protein